MIEGRISHLDDPGENETVTSVETFDGSKQMFKVLSSRRVKINMVEFKPEQKTTTCQL